MKFEWINWPISFLPGWSQGIITIIILFYPAILLAQVIDQPQRFEIELERNEDPFEIVSLGEDGLIIFRQIHSKGLDPNFVFFELIKLDTGFNKIWTKIIPADHTKRLLGWQFYNDRLYFLFGDFRGTNRNYDIISIDHFSNMIFKNTVKNIIPLNIDGFMVGDQAAYIVGYYNYRPVVIQYNFETDVPRALPTIFNDRHEIVFYKIGYYGEFEIILQGRTFDKRTSLFIKAFDEQGNLIRDVIMNNDPKRSLLFGNTTEYEDGIQLIAGTYGSSHNQYSRGLFIGEINEYGENEVQYHSYGDLKNFFTYMKARRAERVKRRIERKSIKGKKAKFNYRLMVHDIFPYKDQYILLGEAFYPRYRTDYSRFGWGPYGHSRFGSSYDRFGMPINNQVSGMNPYMIESYQYTHAVVVGFSQSGNILWDNSFEISDVSSPVLDRFVYVSLEEDYIVLLYVFDNVIRTKIISENQVIEGKSFDDIKLRFEDDVVKSTNLAIEGLNPWYYRTFFAYGVQNIRHKGDALEQSSREVFFINKVVYR